MVTVEDVRNRLLVALDEDYQRRRAEIAEEVWKEHRAKPFWVRWVERLLGIPDSLIDNRVAFRSPTGGK